MMHKKNLVKYLKTEIFQFQSMEHRSNANPVRQIQTKNFYRNFYRLRDRFDQSKIWKSEILKTEQVNAETPQNTLFYE